MSVLAALLPLVQVDLDDYATSLEREFRALGWRASTCPEARLLGHDSLLQARVVVTLRHTDVRGDVTLWPQLLLTTLRGQRGTGLHDTPVRGVVLAEWLAELHGAALFPVLEQRRCEVAGMRETLDWPWFADARSALYELAAPERVACGLTELLAH